MSPAKSMHTADPAWQHVDEFLKTQIAATKPKPKEIAHAAAIADLLHEEFPGAHCALDFKNAFQLLIATILSAQCTDARVNIVTPNLWKKYPTPQDLANAPEGELEEVIRSTGFFNAKARSLRETARQVVEEFGGKMPSAIEDLTRLRGAGRKTANVLRMHAFDLPGIAVDTHVTRLSARLGLTKASDPVKIEIALASLLPPSRWTHFADALILHGRKTCSARAPKCDACRLAHLCPSAFNAVPEKESKPARAKKSKS